MAVRGLIKKASPVKADEKSSSVVSVRIPNILLTQIDEILKNRYGISRNGWILQAIHEKLTTSK